MSDGVFQSIHDEDEIILVLDPEDPLVVKGEAYPMRSSRRPFSGVFSWKCSHVQCDARPWSVRALFCRAVKRPLCVFLFFL